MTSQYSDTLMDHFRNPRNVGALDDPDGVGTAGDITCGDVLVIQIKVDRSTETIAAIGFQCKGCPAAIATASAMTELVLGMHLDAASELTDIEIADAVGGLPEEKHHCSNLGADALYNAVMDYVAREIDRLSRDAARKHGGP
jgi:NifU-like protein involved in Fe-S cluster formation